MPENPFIEPENPQNTKSRIEIRDTPTETGEAPEANDLVEPRRTKK